MKHLKLTSTQRDPGWKQTNKQTDRQRGREGEEGKRAGGRERKKKTGECEEEMEKCVAVGRAALLLLCLFQAPVTEAQNCGPGESSRCPSSWTSLWYVWLILLTIFLLLLCGVTASCLRCCQRTKPQVPTFPTRPYEVTVIAIDNDHAVSPTSSLQYISASRNSTPFQEANGFILPPPPYSLYAMEMPPSYEMALEMANPVVIHNPKRGPENPGRSEGSSATEGMSAATSSALS
uniref:transmembrane protein 52-like n=1 Tax=Pristiophorus japonicus TaxID=55135 RepID=UPI00398E82EC